MAKREYHYHDLMMTKEEFIRIQDQLGLTGFDLANRIGATPDAVSKWRNGNNPIKGYIALSMRYLLLKEKIKIAKDALNSL
ncbi:MAG: hypothetical protein JXQ27_14010 [Acidobacteria bacterium]|nr:hypothetical protein [Acidobacteriota bacterium]